MCYVKRGDTGNCCNSLTGMSKSIYDRRINLKKGRGRDRTATNTTEQIKIGTKN